MLVKIIVLLMYYVHKVEQLNIHTGSGRYYVLLFNSAVTFSNHNYVTNYCSLIEVFVEHIPI